MTEFALNIQQLSFAYPSKKALNQVSFSIKAGECTVLLGANGAGKSTLFALITRLYDSHQGQIELCGWNVRQQTSKALANLGVVFQQSTLDLDLTVAQNLHYHAALHGMNRKLANQRIDEELARFEILPRRGEKVRQLNGGHRRRVEIARALLPKPKLLLLDEPTVGLDVPSRQAIVRYIHQLATEQQLAVLWATHLIDEIYPEDNLLILHQGQLKAEGQVADILQFTAKETIQAAFHYLTQGA